MIHWIKKHWEVLSYLIFGVLTTLLNIVLYALFNGLFGYETANSWGNVLDNVLCILFAYGTNRTWVFASKTHGKAAWQEFGKFVTCRLGTMVLDVTGNPVSCPICKSKKSLAGAGSYIEVPVPTDGMPDMRNPIQMLGIDRDSLDYNVEDLDRLRKEIIASCVGVDSTIINEASLADKQVDASYESKDNVLNRVKKGFEDAQWWVDTTICKLRYPDTFISANINYGTEFYTLTPEVLRSRYNTAKEGGASDTELDALRTQLIETEYRHNPMQMQRMMLLSELEPYRHLKKSEVLNLFNNNIIDAEEVILKNDFSNFVSRFERENTNILDFGADISHEAKIETIYNTLLEYARERKSNKSDIQASER